MSARGNPKVYMDVKIGAVGAGRIIFELFNDLTPKTTENFRALATGQYGKANGVRLHYLNTKFHRIVDGFVIQGGDITHSGGKGGFSIYGRTFVDENFSRTHSCAGLLSMYNTGRNTNASQFFITLKPCPHLDGKHIVFGQVIDGMEIVRKISKVSLDKDDKPRVPVIVVGCGEVDDFRKFLEYDPFKKEVFDELKQAKEQIIKDQYLMRKMLSEGLEANEAYAYKQRLEKCQKDLAEVNKREELLLQQQRQKGELEGTKKTKPSEDLEESDKQILPQQTSSEPEEDALRLTEDTRKKLGTATVDLLLDIKMKINKAKQINARAALEEEIRENDDNYHKIIKKKEWLERKSLAEEELKARNLPANKLYLMRNALVREKDDTETDNSGVKMNIFGEDAVYKAYDKRCKALEKDKDKYASQIDNPNRPSIPNEEALDRLAADIEKQQQKRAQYSRRRIFNEDEPVTYIDERNRVYNEKLNRSFGKYASGIKTALEMNAKK